MSIDATALREHIRELIGTPSVSSVSSDWDMPNQPVIAGLAERLSSAGWQVETQNLPGTEAKQNLIATLGSGEGGLILSGHTDTVPCNEELWNSDPFALSERDNRFYGLGTADMKSFLAIAMAAAGRNRPG